MVIASLSPRSRRAASARRPSRRRGRRPRRRPRPPRPGLDPPQLPLGQQVGPGAGPACHRPVVGADHRADARGLPPRPGLHPVREHRPHLPQPPAPQELLGTLVPARHSPCASRRGRRTASSHTASSLRRPPGTGGERGSRSPPPVYRTCVRTRPRYTPPPTVRQAVGVRRRPADESGVVGRARPAQVGAGVAGARGRPAAATLDQQRDHGEHHEEAGGSCAGRPDRAKPRRAPARPATEPGPVVPLRKNSDQHPATSSATTTKSMIATGTNAGGARRSADCPGTRLADELVAQTTGAAQHGQHDQPTRPAPQQRAHRRRSPARPLPIAVSSCAGRMARPPSRPGVPSRVAP